MLIKKDIKSEYDLERELRAIGSDPAGVAIMKPKFTHKVIKVCNISTPAALILKQEMLSKGGEVATPHDMITHAIPSGDILISGTPDQYRSLTRKLALQPFGLKRIAVQLDELVKEPALPKIVIRGQSFDLSKNTYVMGILNLTPDSFSDGGLYTDPGLALNKVRQMINDGADIIDIGGQSTRPGAEQIPPQEEIKRILPVIKSIRQEFNIPLSVDTFNSQTAREAISAGADMINDISGLQFDDQMLNVAKELNCPLILMHIKGTPRDMQNNPKYEDIIEEIFTYFQNITERTARAGIPKENIIIDPGIGFGKTVEHNLLILNKLKELRTLGYPILIGTSRKSFIGQIAGGTPQERMEGTIVSNALAIWNGASIIRVHDVKELKKAAIITDAIKNVQGGNPID